MHQAQPAELHLELNDENLIKHDLMAIAWKKAHHYIRSTNWYADNFELDKSALDLHDACKSWANDVKDGSVCFKPLELVPAPKTQVWHFMPSRILSKNMPCLDWQPVIPESKQDQKSETDKNYSYPVKLRPLAHIGIKEQTIMTLVMMCLANDVETQQGDPATEYEEVHDKKIVSYGNRIYCTYRDGKAEHSYGATTVYSKFFQDYQKFLQRPYFFANRHLTEKAPDEEVYLVELDLRQFFDCVDRKKLIEKIQSFTKVEANKTFENRVVRSVLNAFDSWDWAKEQQNLYEVCKTDLVDDYPSGIPQGLVAGGFLANIYMLDFDSELAGLMGQNLNNNDDSKIKLLDYCRYVDDMRLVLLGPKRYKDNRPNPADEIKKIINKWFNEKLELLVLKLQINDTKTKVKIYRGKTDGISQQLNEIQSALSGPVSFEDAQDQLTQLESLLSICPQKETEQDGENCRLNRLADIEKNIFDVRDDTLQRFAANKISKTLSTIRHFTAREVDEHNQAMSGDWDYLQERMARRLIAVWSRDPSLVLLLVRMDTVLEQTCGDSEQDLIFKLAKGFRRISLPDTVDSNQLAHSIIIAMVQSKLPHKADFTKAGLLLDAPQYRVKHRRHVARVSQLVLKHIEAQRTDVADNDNKKHQIDLIIWPELSVHPEDMDILKQLAQKTHAIVLAGMGFEHQHGIKGPINRAVWIVPKTHNGNQNELIRYQGKWHMTKDERKVGIQSWRPYQLVLELLHPQFAQAEGFKLTSAICYDATDIKLSADLVDKSNAFFIPALNLDVNSFDTMVEALHYHMYQPVVLVNTGEFGGSYAMAPYKEHHHRLIAHASGNDQVAINTFELNMFDFRRDGVGKSLKSKTKLLKTPPAGFEKAKLTHNGLF
ncbi:reverse transcriptase domain-containing protein [Thiomicrospira sp. R3]|uniref:reverse transcriptase domain-containing protein n=1 Tax=Thiomicrospira sp. R3 TaxID=3035472 RepID=UPI00259B323F|nr:reverse transcriptase domain-containing protein [Thiomicrospira sp. R3]WFE68807.1 reverse transcriptase domain-containing protein [Thiomicrospira sp. R3]